FDRGAKPCLLFRPLGALRRLCSLILRGSRLREQAGGGLKLFFSGTTRFLLVTKEKGLYKKHP
ncbi:MAG: hypothetical protein II254_01275, partial [Oscillospiraceae bacterium]|nr:hypothetical protein [Oscillospiraceae bacterium]